MKCKIKITIFLLFLCILSNPSNGQNILISEPLESVRESVKIIGRVQNDIIVYKESFQNKVFQIFSSDLKPKKEIEIEFLKNQIDILHFNVLNDKIYILYAYHQKGKTIFRIKFIENNYQQTSDSIVAIADDLLSLNLFKVSTSENKSKLLVYTAVEGIQLYWFACDIASRQLLKFQTRKNYESYFKDYFNAMLINNSGEIYFTIENNNSVFKKNMHQVEIYSVRSDSFSLNNRIDLSSMLLSDFKFIYDEQNKNLNFIALYGDNFNKTKGIVNISGKAEGRTPKKCYVFEDSLIKNMTGKKRKKYDGIPNLIIKDVILRKDGGCIVIAEQFFKYEYRMPSSPYNDINMIRNINYYYENVMVLSLNPDGGLLWREILHKSQKSENDDGICSSFCVLRNSGYLKFLFNDQLQKASSIYEFSINGKGISKRSKIFDNDSKLDMDIIPEFRNAVQIASNEVVTMQRRHNKLKIIKISY